jgi:hypothetical protein
MTWPATHTDRAWTPSTDAEWPWARPARWLPIGWWFATVTAVAALWATVGAVTAHRRHGADMLWLAAARPALAAAIIAIVYPLAVWEYTRPLPDRWPRTDALAALVFVAALAAQLWLAVLDRP